MLPYENVVVFQVLQEPMARVSCHLQGAEPIYEQIVCSCSPRGCFSERLGRSGEII